MEKTCVADSEAVTVLNPTGGFPIVLTCEHAAYTLPERYGTLGLAADDLRRHIGWDVGAWAVVQALLRHVDSVAIASTYSRLLIDCNRALSDHDLIIPESDGTPIPGNRGLTDAERHGRIREFYDPYHAAVDRAVRARAQAAELLLSVHSFTPTLDGKERPFDVGILFDDYEDLAREFGQRLAHTGYRVRDNEPYSGYAGLIFSARRHGRRHGLPYLEIEMNNELLLTPAGVADIGRRLGRVLGDMFSQTRFEEG